MNIQIHVNTPDRCGCDILGDGSKQDPIRLVWCSLHAATSAMHRALLSMPCHCLADFLAKDTASEKHHPCCPKSLAGAALLLSMPEVSEADHVCA